MGVTGERDNADAVDRLRCDLRRRSLLLARLTDDVRARLKGVILSAWSLEDEELGSERATAARDLRQGCEGILEVLAGAHDFAAGGAGPAVAAEEFELHTVLRAAVAGQVFTADAKGIKLACLVHRDVPRRASGDAAGLRRLLVAFVENAIRHTEGGGIQVRISVDEMRDDALVLRFSIPEEQDGIAGRIRAGGAGPGFEMFRDLVALMGGAVGVEDAGLWFTVALAPPPDAPRPAIPDPAGPARRGAPPPHRPVLLVSSSPDGVPEILVTLQRNGYAVELEEDCKRFPMRLREREYSLVLMDADGGSHAATLATWPSGGKLRRVPIVGVPRAGGKRERVDEEALLRLVERCIHTAHGG